jgi:hypothetical protein
MTATRFINVSQRRAKAHGPVPESTVTPSVMGASGLAEPCKPPTRDGGAIY